MLKNIMILTTILGSSLLVHAASATAYFVEPSVGYRTETLKFVDLLQNETKIKTATPVFGLKLGLQSATGILFNIAADYSTGKTTHEPEVTNPPDFSHQSGSVQVGISAMGLMKIYLGYIFHNQFEVKSTPTYSGFKLKGAGYQVGLTFSLFSNFSLGAQYNINQYKEITGNNFLSSNSMTDHFDKVDVQDLSLFGSLTF